MNSLHKSILKVIAYFDVFSYPVTPGEINFFLDQKAAGSHVLQLALDELAAKQLISNLNGFYLLRKEQSIIDRRLKGNAGAIPQIKKAVKIARFLSKFPYIRGVAISGSLSKHFSYEGSDLDFFIITKANRLWLAKTIFTFFLKLARLFNKGHLYCLNYFIDEDALEILEKNIFTATEIITLLPCEGEKIFNSFFEANSWVNEYLPNNKVNLCYGKEMKYWLPKGLVEMVFNGSIGNSIDTAILNHYHKKWVQLRKQNIFTDIGFQLGGLIAEKHCCKPFPQHIQKNILDKFEAKYREAISFGEL